MSKGLLVVCLGACSPGCLLKAAQPQVRGTHRTGALPPGVVKYRDGT